MNDKTLLAVAKAECLHCRYLVGELGSTEEPCHQETWCPATKVSVVLGTDMNSMADRLAASWNGMDAEETSIVLKEMSGLHKSVQDRIWLMAKGKLSV